MTLEQLSLALQAAVEMKKIDPERGTQMASFALEKYALYREPSAKYVNHLGEIKGDDEIDEMYCIK